MLFTDRRAALLVAAALLGTSGCNGTGAVPASGGAGASATSFLRTGASPEDTTSILKLLKKNVTIGSTVDPKNGDMGPRSLATVLNSNGRLKKGDLLVCNFSNSAGKAGIGTTIEQLAPKANSSPAQFVQSDKIEGCNGDAVTTLGDQVFATGLTSKVMVWFNQAGVLKKTYAAPIVDPIGDGDAPPLYIYSPEFVFIGDASNGNVDSISLGAYHGNKKLLAVVKGFSVKQGAGWSGMGPSGFAYNSNSKSKAWDTLYVADGACDAVVAIAHASNLLKTAEITVSNGCKSFKCLYPKTSCATLVKTGKPLDTPVAEAILPNGNLIVANGAGGNTLVEMTPTGQVLDTKVVDTSKTAGIFGLLAVGTNDGNTALFYTDSNTNTVQELEQ